jgi:hypothetical protein
MTYREGSIIALRELGYTEDQIKKRFEISDPAITKMYGPAFLEQNKNNVIPVGREREFINNMKLTYIISRKSDTKTLLKMLRHIKTAIRREQEGN